MVGQGKISEAKEIIDKVADYAKQYYNGMEVNDIFVDIYSLKAMISMNAQP